MGKNAIRVKSEEQILDGFKAIVNEISKMQLEFGSYEEIITSSLFFWYGCLSMDKICRKMDINGILPKNRLEIHDYLKNNLNSNPWIYTGFISASKFRRTPDQFKIKDYSWIPKDPILIQILIARYLSYYPSINFTIYSIIY